MGEYGSVLLVSIDGWSGVGVEVGVGKEHRRRPGAEFGGTGRNFAHQYSE